MPSATSTRTTKTRPNHELPPSTPACLRSGPERRPDLPYREATAEDDRLTDTVDLLHRHSRHVRNPEPAQCLGHHNRAGAGGAVVDLHRDGTTICQRDGVARLGPSLCDRTW